MLTHTDAPPTTPPLFGDPRLPDRFWAKVTVTDGGCWHWDAYIRDNGYAQFAVTGEGVRYAHRVAYAALVGPIEEGHELDHTCHSEASGCRAGSACAHRRCVNPAHLEQVTHQENMRRRGLGVTHCTRNHEYTDANTYWQDGRRSCLTCRRSWRSRRAAAGSPRAFARAA